MHPSLYCQLNLNSLCHQKLFLLLLFSLLVYEHVSHVLPHVWSTDRVKLQSYQHEPRFTLHLFEQRRAQNALASCCKQILPHLPRTCLNPAEL